MSTQAQQQEIIEANEVEAIQYLTFRLDGEAFATEIGNVREVLEHTRITRVPRTPEYMLGVINLRGSVVPVVDMRLQFGMPVGEQTVDTCIIIIEVEIEGSLTVLGAMADSVQEVVDLLPTQLSPAPSLGTCIDNEFISAMGKIDDRFVIIVDLDVIFTIDSEMFSNLAEMYHNTCVERISSGIFDESANDETHEQINDGVDKAEKEQGDVVNVADDEPVDIGIDLGTAIQKHAQWKLKLHSAINKKDKLDTTEVSSDNCCVLGKWLHGQAKEKYSDMDSYHDCLAKHKAFHVEAGKVAYMINDEKYERAEAMLDAGTPYIKVSKSVAAAIIALRREIE